MILIRYLVVIIFVISFTINGQSSENTDPVNNDSHHAHHNHVALFLGSTTFYNTGESHFSLGVDYLYRPNNDNPWAYSIIAEVIFAEHTEYVIGLPVYHYIMGSWWMRAGPGIEIIQEEEHHGNEVKTTTQIEFLFRVGTGYSFHIGDFVLSPSVDIDFVRNNDALVWGLNFGYSF